MESLGFSRYSAGGEGGGGQRETRMGSIVIAGTTRLEARLSFRRKAGVRHRLADSEIRGRKALLERGGPR
jgi:hypothetical protein